VRSGNPRDGSTGEFPDGRGSQDAGAVLNEIASVRDVLRRMCQVSVTKKSLREAVRDALVPVLREHREDLFPEIAELRALLAEGRVGSPVVATPETADGAPAPLDVARRLADFEARVGRLAGLETEVHDSFEAVNTRLAGVDGRVDEVSGRVDGLAGRFSADAESARRAEVGGARNAESARRADAGAADKRLAALDERLSAVAARLANFSSDMESSVARTAENGARIDKVDARLVDLDSTVDGLDGLGGRVGDSETHAAETKGRVERAEADLAQAGKRLDGVDAKAGELVERVDRVEGAVGTQVAALENQLRELEARLSGLFEGRLSGVDERVSAVGGRVDTVEENLRKELDNMVQGLASQLVELREILARVDSTLLENTGPQRQAIQAVQAGLGELEDRLESRFGRMTAQVAKVSEKVEVVSQDVGRVSAGVEHIDSLTPELRSLAGRFTEVRQGLQAVAGRVGESDRDVVLLKETVAERLSDLKQLVHAGIERWEQDQSHANERLSGLRDTLRDQLHEVSAQFQKTQKSLLGKVMRKEPGLKLSRDEWDQLSGKIEGIVSGLEGILTRKREG